MNEVTSVNGMTGAVVLTAAEVEAVPTTAEGQPGGVATLDGSGVLPGAQLPSSVVSSSAVPSGVASTDTAAVQAAINALSVAAGSVNVATALFNSPTPFQINAPLYKPWNVNVEGNAVFKAVSGFPAGSVLLQDAPPTTVAAESNGGNITNIETWATPSAGVLKVASTTGYPSQGQVRVVNASGTAVINYTGTTGTSFTGCMLAGGTGGVVSTGGAVSARTYEGVIGAGITLDSNNIAQNALYIITLQESTLGARHATVFRTM